MAEPDVQRIVERVLARLEGHGVVSTRAPRLPLGVFSSVDEAVDAAQHAHRRLVGMRLDERHAIIESVRSHARREVQTLATMAVHETGLGRVADKVEEPAVLDRTLGPEILRPEAVSVMMGSLMERAPYGVIGAITPSTNPTETILTTGFGMVSGQRGGVQRASVARRRCRRGASTSSTGPVRQSAGFDHLMTCVAQPTIETAQQVMQHRGTCLIVVTRSALPCALESAASQGDRQPPVVVDHTADLSQAAAGIVLGASLDNNIMRRRKGGLRRRVGLR